MFREKFKKFAGLRSFTSTPSSTSRAAGAGNSGTDKPRGVYLQGARRTYRCIHCRAYLASHDELVSKLFQGNHGRAYLFNKVVNVKCRQAVKRQLLTGAHAVADIYCVCCDTTLGWKYVQAYVPAQKYKEGKFIIELIHMFKENDWDLTSYNAKSIIRQVDDHKRRLLDIRNFIIGSKFFGSPERRLDARLQIEASETQHGGRTTAMASS